LGGQVPQKSPETNLRRASCASADTLLARAGRPSAAGRRDWGRIPEATPGWRSYVGLHFCLETVAATSGEMTASATASGLERGCGALGERHPATLSPPSGACKAFRQIQTSENRLPCGRETPTVNPKQRRARQVARASPRPPVAEAEDVTPHKLLPGASPFPQPPRPPSNITLVVCPPTHPVERYCSYTRFHQIPPRST
jgi:hypothetical protein